MLISGLPPTGTAIARATGGDIPGWGNAEELLALIAELLDGGNRMFFSAHTKKGTTAPKPLEVRRPIAHDQADDDVELVEAPRKRQATSEEIKAFFGGGGGSIRYTGNRVD